VFVGFGSGFFGVVGSFFNNTISSAFAVMSDVVFGPISVIFLYIIASYHSSLAFLLL
jgi:hypothetical protein